MEENNRSQLQETPKVPSLKDRFRDMVAASAAMYSIVLPAMLCCVAAILIVGLLAQWVLR